MNYIQIILTSTTEEENEILIAQLSALGFDGFEETEKMINAFIEEDHFNEDELKSILNERELSYQKQIINKQNWNQLWESNFDTVIVDDFVGIRADFHEAIVGVEHEIIITPKMSFGTGHHATTFMMMQLMREIDFSNKTVFDFGTGTGILAILAEKLGSTKITAIDNDDWCIENANENILKNNCSQIEIYKSEKPAAQQQFQIVIANINKHIILANILSIDQSIISGGDILLSGLLIDDEADIHSSVQSFGWQYQKTVQKGGWIALHFKKA
ncbi:MAG: 50S ribosomal protein L11 methyltransferase [Bacteroidota bacterium]|nr:50S ribosomal protein L11 methyltransferase [Bacteroidota bacterium]